MQRNSLFSTSSSSNVKLPEQEKAALDTIEKLIDSNNNDDINYLIDALPKYPVDVLQRLYDASPKLQDFCQKNVKFHEALAKELKEEKRIDIAIASMDGKEHLTVFDIFRAVDNMSEYYKIIRSGNARKSNEARLRCMQSLEMACKLGLYQALTARCDQNITLLLSQAASSESKEKAIASILHDTKRLSNLYWKMGYIQAGCILQKLAEKIAPIWKEKGREGIDRLAILHEENIKNFLCASLLEDHPESKKIELASTKGKGYIAGMEEKGIKIPAWDEAKIKLRSWVNNDDATYERLLKAAKEEIDTILKPNSSAEAKTTPKSP